MNVEINKHDPENGLFGNCNQMCLNFLLKRTDAPHFFNSGNNEQAHKDYDAWLKDNRLFRILIAYNAKPNEVLDTIDIYNPNLKYIMIADSGVADHSVVCQGGKIIYDPAGRIKSFVGPTRYDGNTWVEIIVKRGLEDES